MLTAVLSALPNPVFFVSPELKVEVMNSAAARVSASRDGQLLLPQRVMDMARQVMAEGRDFLSSQYQDAFTWRVGAEPRHFLPQLVGVRDEKKNIFGVAVLLLDVTQFRLMDELRSNFVSTVSHEIKTPLTSIRMAVHMLQAEMVGPLQARQAALLTTAREDIERLLRLLNNLLDVARFEQGMPQMIWERTDVSALMREAVQEVQTLASSRNLDLKVECADGLPDICIDRARIHHVLRNLLTNAIRHSDEGADIQVSAALAENGGVQFSVIDSGPGIPKEHVSRLFEKFYRVPGQKTNGSGLGLSIAREIILAHTGSIGCESEPGTRTAFFFSLPSADEQEKRLASVDEPGGRR